MGWIVSDSDHLGGKPRVRDTRISVALLLEWLAAGMTIGEIVKEYPSLTEERFAERWKNWLILNCWLPVKIVLHENIPESLAGALEDLGQTSIR